MANPPFSKQVGDHLLCEHHTAGIKILSAKVRWCSRCGAVSVDGGGPYRWKHPSHVEFNDRYRRQPSVFDPHDHMTPSWKERYPHHTKPEIVDGT